MRNRTKNDKNQSFTIYLYILISYITNMRLKSIITTELVNDKLKASERLERAMNSSKDLDEECLRIKYELRELVLIDQMIALWQDINKPDTGIFDQEEKKETNE